MNSNFEKKKKIRFDSAIFMVNKFVIKPQLKLLVKFHNEFSAVRKSRERSLLKH